MNHPHPVTDEPAEDRTRADDGPTVTFRVVLALIQAERDQAAARCPTWSPSTAAEYVPGNYERLGANDVLGRLEVAVLRLRQETLECPPRS